MLSGHLPDGLIRIAIGYKQLNIVWPNTTSEMSPYHLEKYPATFQQSRMHWD